MTDIQQLMQMGQQLQARMAQLQEELSAREISASAGGGMVKAIMNGKQELLEIKIEPEVIDPKDKEMLEELVVAAVSQARERATEAQQEKMSEVTGGLPLPGMGGGLPF